MAEASPAAASLCRSAIHWALSLRRRDKMWRVRDARVVASVVWLRSRQSCFRCEESLYFLLGVRYAVAREMRHNSSQHIGGEAVERSVCR
jgi:hypothetical protein